MIAPKRVLTTMLQDVTGATSAPDLSLTGHSDRLAPSLARTERAAARLGRAFAGGRLTAAQRRMAAAIFHDLATEAAVQVRRTLAEHIMASPLLPRDLALRLARDVEAVALPVLEHAKVLEDADLLNLIAEGGTARQQAIARRETVSEKVSASLIDLGKKEVVVVLLPNAGASIPEAAYGKALDTFKDDPEVQALLVGRASLPCAVKERLIRLLSDDLKARLVERHDFPEALLNILTRHGREKALVANLAQFTDPQVAAAAARRLQLNRELTPSLLLRALCAGQLELFGAALAILAGASVDAAQRNLARSGTPALAALYTRARLPAVLQHAFQAALEEVLRARRAAAPVCEARLVDGFLHRYREVCPDGLESAIYQLDRLSLQG